MLGVTVATSLIAGAPVYIKTLERQALNTAIDRVSDISLDIYVLAPNVQLDRTSLQRTERSLERAVQSHISDIYRGHERHLRAPLYLAGLPKQPLSTRQGQRGSRGYLQYLSNVERHVRFVEGGMATDRVSPGPGGPVVEAVLGSSSARQFGLGVDDVVTLTPSLGDPVRISARIVGIVEAIDRTDEYWQDQAGALLEPEPPDEPTESGIDIDPGDRPLALFVTREAMIEGLGNAYPGVLVTSSWFVFVDKERLKGLSDAESRSRLQGMEDQLSRSVRGSAVFSGIKKLTSDFERHSFFSSVPLLLMLSMMVMTVLYFLSMMVSYLVRSREDDVALLRSRGVSMLHLVKLNLVEGTALIGAAVALAPFIAMGAVALAGKLPYFRDITGGKALPVELHWLPFAVAAGAGLLILTLLVVPSVIGSRTGLVRHQLRSWRPPTVPFFQRHYLDVGLLVVGGLVFWELHARGHIVSGGLFKDVQVNEALLVAPALFLTGVALLFTRFFPQFVRFLSGESAMLLHLVAAATVVTLAPASALEEAREGNGLVWLVPLALLSALTVTYWATQRARRFRPRLAGLAVQGALVAAFVVLEPPATDSIRYVPTISLMAIVPAQAAFVLLNALARVSPVWVSLGLWHMARNPSQYSWLVLLLVLVTGLGIMTTTVGGTLERSRQERVLYDMATDLRVSRIGGYAAGDTDALKQRYEAIPGVTTVSLALRADGKLGPATTGNRFEVLALDSRAVPKMVWWRDDFAARPLAGIMETLRSGGSVDPVTIPGGATSIGVWVKPDRFYARLFLWMVLQDAGGVIDTVSLGGLGPPEWSLMSTEIPPGLEPPLRLISMQLFEPVSGAAGTPGAILLDDIRVTVGGDGETWVLEDFEGHTNWTVLATSMISSDSITSTTEDAYNGEMSGLFSFGKDTDRGIRGFYRSQSGTRLPIVVSSSFISSSGVGVGDGLIVDIMGRLIPAVVAGTVEYFPTMDPRGGGFVLADLDALLSHLNVLSPTSTISPNEAFIQQVAGVGNVVRDAVRAAGSPGILVRDKQSLLDSIRLDPMVTAGWRAMVLLSIGIIVLTAGIGYMTYLLSLARRSRGETGFLRCLGLSGHQLSRLLGIEHLVVAAVGIGLGTWAGFQISTLMVSSVAVTETGKPVIPPFLSSTDWGFMVPVYAALVVLFVAMLYHLTRSLRRLDLQSISRAEG